MERTHLSQRLSNWANSERQHARDLREEYAATNVDTCAAADERDIVTLRGTLQTVTLRPRGGVPVLEAELFDGTASITLVWLGRRRIAGIVPGRSLQAEGRVGTHDGTRTIFNPRYELIP
jgi:hypothetical protein